MTMFPTPEQVRRSIREGLEFTIQRHETRIKLLETLIQKYASHVGDCEGVSYLESRYRGAWGDPDLFTDEEWAEIRRIAEEYIG